MSYFLTPWEYRFNDIVAYGNIDVEGQVNVVGNIYAEYIFGNIQGNLISQLPAVGTLDVRGNVIGNYANMHQIIGNIGNIGNTQFLGGNVFVSGNVVALGNITASYFLGNGSQLEGVTFTLPGTGNLDITNGNIAGNYANMHQIIGNIGNIGNTRFLGGNVFVSGNVVAFGNITASYFLGNGSQLEGVTSTLPGTADLDITNGNIIGNYANMHQIIGNIGNVGNTRFVGGNVAVSGQINVLGNVVSNHFLGNITGNFANIGNTRFLGGNVAVSGQVNALGNVVANHFLGNITGNFANIGNTRFDGGNVAVSGQVNVLGNVVANHFLGNITGNF
ncbi:Chlorovirus glycoprotein repeat domain-containing protein, partial [Acanthocystis turfacea Chlorella virus TN603.4.2]